MRVSERLGGLHSARCLLWSVDFAEVEELQRTARWAEATALMVDAAVRLRRGGADFLVVCANTMHLMADAVAASVDIPLLHIVDPTAERVQAGGFQRVGLLGTAFTMEQDFFKARLADRHGLQVLIPTDADRATLHLVIYEELVRGRIEPASRAACEGIIARLVNRGAQAIILGCTELMLLVKAEDSMVPLFDTTFLHATAAADLAIG